MESGVGPRAVLAYGRRVLALGPLAAGLRQFRAGRRQGRLGGDQGLRRGVGGGGRHLGRPDPDRVLRLLQGLRRGEHRGAGVAARSPYLGPRRGGAGADPASAPAVRVHGGGQCGCQHQDRQDQVRPHRVTLRRA
ncbi:hypothetical protein SFR_2218 [Streptomyces sp. FR-008]|nr:hypothetical protein SFR_2218 [Streptomyces sp. FR-008]